MTDHTTKPLSEVEERLVRRVAELQDALSEAISRNGDECVYADLHRRFGHLLSAPSVGVDNTSGSASEVATSTESRRPLTSPTRDPGEVGTTSGGAPDHVNHVPARGPEEAGASVEPLPPGMRLWKDIKDVRRPSEPLTDAEYYREAARIGGRLPPQRTETARRDDGEG